MDKITKAEKALYEGDFKTAEILYLDLIKNYPDDKQLNNNLAIALMYQKSYDQALQYLQKIHEKFPDDLNTLVNLGNTYKFLGNFAEAVNYYNAVLKISNDLDDVYINMAIIYKNQGDLAKAIEYYNQAIRINPDNYAAYYNAAITYKNSGDIDKSIEYYKHAIRTNPGFVQSYINLANLHYADHNFTEAINYYEKSLALNPNNFNGLFSLGKIYLTLGNYYNSEFYLNKALNLNPNLEEIYFILGNLKAEQEKIEEAVSYYNQAIEINPDYNQAYKNMGFAYEIVGDSINAQECFNKYLNLVPGDEITRFHSNTMMSPLMFDNQEIDIARDKLLKYLNQTNFERDRINLNELQEKNIYPSQELIYQGRDDFAIRKKFASLFKGFFPHLNTKEKITGKPKVAFLVTKGHEGVFLKSTKGMINNLSKEIFDISVVYNNPLAETMIRDHIDPKINLVAVSRVFTKAINEIAEQKFDIINYWEVGTDAFGFYLPFYRLAPIQISSWGWPITSGIPEMDYYVSSESLEPENGDDYYSEKLIRLKYMPSYYYRPETEHTPRNVEYFGLPENKNIYLCSQNLRKVHPDFDDLINDILKRDEKGIVVFISNKYQFITISLKNRIFNKYPDLAKRIFFTPFMNYQDYVALMRISAVSLDTLYYCGANTSCDAFVNNLPVVTLPGEFQRGRQTYKYYKAMNIDDCIVKTRDEYINLAIKIANDKSYRNEIVVKINNSNHLIFESNLALKEFSDFLESAVETFNS